VISIPENESSHTAGPKNSIATPLLEYPARSGSAACVGAQRRHRRPGAATGCGYANCRRVARRPAAAITVFGSGATVRAGSRIRLLEPECATVPVAVLTSIARVQPPKGLCT
jgi:hypothetical protein